MALLIFGIGQAEPDDTLNSMTSLGLEFQLIGSETDYENATTEVTVDIKNSVEEFVEKVEMIFEDEDKAFALEMLGSIYDPETQEPLFEQ